MTLKRILIALGDYYPNPSANGICVEKIIEELKNNGFEVHCVVNGYSRHGTSKIVNGVYIHFIKTPFLWDLYESAMNESQSIIKKSRKFLWKTLIYLRLPLFLMAFPAESTMHRNHFSHEINRVIKEHSIDVVLGVNKPVEAMWGAYIAAKKADVPMVSYFLDPLAGGIENHIVGKKNSFERAKKLEKKILDYSTKAIFMEEHKASLLKRYGKSYEKKLSFLGAPLLENHFVEKQKKGEEDTKTVLYAGAITREMRDPRFIMETFKHVSNAKLIMYISNESNWLDKYCNPNVEIRGRVSHDIIVEEMKSADALLNIGNTDPLFAPSKVIEYIGYGKPIITTYRIDNDTSLNYLKNYPVSLCIDERNKNIVEAACQIDNLLNKNITFGFKDIEKTFWKNRAKAFVDVIESIQRTV